MGAWYRISDRVVIVTARGTVTNADLHRALRDASGDSAFRAGSSVVIRDRNARYDVSIESAQQAASILGSILRRYAPRTAVVREDGDSDSGIARLMQTYADQHGSEHRLFADDEAALAWAEKS